MRKAEEKEGAVALGWGLGHRAMPALLLGLLFLLQSFKNIW